MCTGIRFTSTDGAMYLGRNLDWSTPFGEHIVITPKGYPLAKAFPEESTTKPAGHAIIGMGITDQGYPLYFDCGNDAGLAVAGLNFPGYAQYEEAPVRGKTNVAAYEFRHGSPQTSPALMKLRRRLAPWQLSGNQ